MKAVEEAYGKTDLLVVEVATNHEAIRGSVDVAEPTDPVPVIVNGEAPMTVKGLQDVVPVQDTEVVATLESALVRFPYNSWPEVKVVLPVPPTPTG